MQEMIYRDYGDFFVVYASRSKSYLLIEDIFSDFFRMLYVNKMSFAEIEESIANEYSVDRATVHNDLVQFCDEMRQAFSFDASASDEVSSNCSAMQQVVFNKMSDLMIPFSATIEVTDSCNLNCVHCYREVPSASYWTESHFLDTLNELKALGTMNLTITGGEPFAHPMITRFLEISEQLGFVISIQSNLLLLNDAIISALQKSVVSDVSVSLYSTRENEHDAITQSSGSMQKTITNIKRLIEKGIPVSINCPVMSINKDAMAGMRKFANDLGIDVKFALKIIPSQNKDKNTERLNVFSRDFILESMRNPEIELYKKERDSIRASSPGTRYCQTGLRSITFDAQGNMLICNAYRKHCGSLNDSSVQELWRDSPILNRWRNQTSLVREKCRVCPAYTYCEPCPAHSYMQSGDENSIDELTCLFGKAFYAADIEYLRKGGEG